MNEENLLLAWKLIPIELLNTLYMVFVATFLAYIVGLPLGVLLVISGHGHIKENSSLHKTLGTLVNIGRSFPFAILIVAIIPFTRFIVGTSLGTTASIVPLTIAAIPFVARMVEVSLREVDKHVIEAATVMGATPMQIIYKVLIPESLASLFLGLTNVLINVIGYSAMAGLMGGGGLGKIAIQYGYYQFKGFLMILTVIVLILLVELVQWAGNKIALSINRKRGKIAAR